MKERAWASFLLILAITTQLVHQTADRIDCVSEEILAFAHSSAAGGRPVAEPARQDDPFDVQAVNIWHDDGRLDLLSSPIRIVGAIGPILPHALRNPNHRRSIIFLSRSTAASPGLTLALIADSLAPPRA